MICLTACAQQPVAAKDTETKQVGGMQIKDAPAAVEKTVLEQSAGGTLVGFTTEKENGETLYEAEMKISGHSKNLLIDASGSIRTVEEETTLSALAPAVQAEVQKSVGKSKILAMESVTKRGKLQGYELQIQDAKGEESGLNLSPAGKPQKDEEGEDEDDDDEEDAGK
jgi:hypothetical protein